MAGKKGRSGGSSAIPMSVKLANGTWKKKDGDPATAVMATGVPTKPEFKNEHADKLWDDTVEILISLDLATAIDTPLLRSLCEMWGLYRDAYDVAVVDPIAREARIAVVTYWAKFESAAARFGMNPSDRSRLRIDKPKQAVRTRQA